MCVKYIQRYVCTHSPTIISKWHKQNTIVKHKSYLKMKSEKFVRIKRQKSSVRAKRAKEKKKKKRRWSGINKPRNHGKLLHMRAFWCRTHNDDDRFGWIALLRWSDVLQNKEQNKKLSIQTYYRKKNMKKNVSQ